MVFFEGIIVVDKGLENVVNKLGDDNLGDDWLVYNQFTG